MNNKLHINGIAHIALNVSNISKSKLFYDKILPHLGMKLVHSSIKSFYYIGGRTGVLIQQLNKESLEGNKKFSQNNLGLHHLCFRMKSKIAIDTFYKILLNANCNIIRGPLSGDCVPGYYYLLFEDPDNIRLEVNYVPDKGVFENKVKFNPSDDY